MPAVHEHVTEVLVFSMEMIRRLREGSFVDLMELRNGAVLRLGSQSYVNRYSLSPAQKAVITMCQEPRVQDLERQAIN